MNASYGYGPATLLKQVNQNIGAAPTSWNYGLLTHHKAPAFLEFFEQDTLDPVLLQWDTSLQVPPAQLYYGFAQFNRGGFLLNNDLDPATNDNSPVGLDKAA